MLAIVALDFYPMPTHHTCDPPQKLVISTGLTDSIAIHSWIERGKIGSKVFFTERNLVLAKKAEFHLGGGHSLEALGLCSPNEPLEYGSRGNIHFCPLLSPEITDARGDVCFPGNDSKGLKIRFHYNVCKTSLPVAETQIGENVL